MDKDYAFTRTSSLLLAGLLAAKGFTRYVHWDLHHIDGSLIITIEGKNAVPSEVIDECGRVGCALMEAVTDIETEPQLDIMPRSATQPTRH